MAIEDEAVVVFIPIGIVAVDFHDFGDEAPARAAFKVHDDVDGITDVGFDGLGAIYRTHWSSIFSFFGLNLSDFGRDQAMFAPPKTQLVSTPDESDEETILVPLRSPGDIKLDKTNLLSRLVEIWGEVPIRLIQHLDLRKSVYGFIGMSDFTMFPILRPGSIVQIDGNQRKIASVKWQNEHDRPIYFIELRGEYLCSWCEIREGHLLAVPYPNSKREIRRFVYPRDAEIVGRVTGVAMRLTESQP